MKEIPLVNQDRGKVVIVDDADYEWASKYRWYLTGFPGNTYASRKIKLDNGKLKSVMMHREILGAPKGKLTDHINHNRLDNRRENLRIADYAQNAWNKPSGNKGSSKYRGVFWHRWSKRWRVQINVRKKLIRIGAFKDEAEAAKAYNAAASKYHGEFATLNTFDK